MFEDSLGPPPPPPDVEENQILQPVWLQTPLTRLGRSRLAKVYAGTIKNCCGLYLTPDPIPKSKTGRYDLIIQRFRARSLYLLDISDVDFAREYINLPQSFPSHALPWPQLVEVLLKEEFGDVISEPSLSSLPSSEIVKERKKQTCRGAPLSDAREVREAYIQTWPQVVPKDIMYESLNAYYKGS